MAETVRGALGLACPAAIPIFAAMNSLGIDRSPQDTRVIVAMSGGVDSSVVAALLQAQGFEVVGVTLQLYDDGAVRGRQRACCAGQDIHDARRVADALGIRHYVLDYEQRFREAVIDDFADAYVAGETPIPCIRCNQTVKFRDLLGTARDLGADALATGHYVRRVDGPGSVELHRAADAARDQSYFLFATTAEQLAFLRFPLGELHKNETRSIAARLGLSIADKPDSQDICFVPQGSYARVIERLRPDAAAPGDIVDLAGRVLGRHEGIVNFTIGQRRGLRVGGSEALYVVRLDAAARRVVVGPREALLTARIPLRAINWLGDGDGPPAGGLGAQVRIRSAHQPVPAIVYGCGPGAAEVVFTEPQAGVAPGQACVVYDGERVLGGGWIDKAAARLAA